MRLGGILQSRRKQKEDWKEKKGGKQKEDWKEKKDGKQKEDWKEKKGGKQGQGRKQEEDRRQTGPAGAGNILAQQWFLTRLCFRTAPGYMTMHVIEAVKLQVSIFFEFIWCPNYILETVEAGGDWKNIVWCMIILTAAIIVSTVSAAVYEHMALPKLKPMLYYAFRMEIYERAREIDLSCYDDTEFYQKFILSTEEADACIDRYLESVRLYCGGSMQFLLSVIFCFILNPLVLVIPALELPVRLWSAKRQNRENVAARMECVEFEQKREYQNRIFYLADYARDLRQNPEMQEKCRGDFENLNGEIRRIREKRGKKIFLFGYLGEAVGTGIIAHGLMLSLLMYETMVLHSLSLAHLVSSYNSSGKVIARGTALVEGWKSIVENSAYVAVIREMMAIKPTIVSRAGKRVPDRMEELSIEHLEFSYVPGRPVLEDISLCIRPGQKIALVGYNGSGKTTLVKLMLRLYDPVKGRICLGDTDIRDFDVEQYRLSIGSVFQDFKIYAASLKENVLMDVEKGTREENYEVEKALYDARFTLRDKRLIYQTDTPLTTEFEKDGVNLSGGEAQKVAIARTLYRKQNLVIMDEPSSALDPLSEYLLNQELNEIAKNKTVIFISHRLSTTRDADCIYMMEKGRIIESGSHEELLALGGKYAAMWKVQAGLYQEAGTI